MKTQAHQRMMGAMIQLLEGYADFQGELEKEAADSNAELDEAEEDPVIRGLAEEMKSVLVEVLDREDYATRDLAMPLAMLTEALDEIDPDVFGGGD